MWGWGEEGQLGLGTESNETTPKRLPLLKKSQAKQAAQQGKAVIAPFKVAAGRSHTVVIIGKRSADVADDEDGDELLSALQGQAMQEAIKKKMAQEEAARKAEEEAEAVRKKAEEEAEAQRLEDERMEREIMEEAIRRTKAAKEAREAAAKAAAEAK